MRATQENILRVLQVYSTEGPEAARKIAPTYGVNPNSVRKLAWKYQVRAKMPDGPRWRPNCPSDQDPRWERARKIGMVVA